MMRPDDLVRFWTLWWLTVTAPWWAGMHVGMRRFGP
jgi:hypothetical protein